MGTQPITLSEITSPFTLAKSNASVANDCATSPTLPLMDVEKLDIG